MKVMARYTALIALLALVVAAPLAAQSQPPQQPPPPTKQPTPPAQPGATPAAPSQPTAPPVNKEEEDAYKAFYDSKDTELTTKLGEEFLQKFPESRYMETVYARLARAYQNVPGQEEKMFSYGEKALAKNADNVDVLVLLAWAIPRRLDAKSLDANQKLTKAEQYSKHAQELLAQMTTKPAHLTEEEFAKGKNESLSMAHSGLGLVYLYRGRLSDSVTELEQAIKTTANPDPADYYLTGIGYSRMDRQAQAADAFGHCAEIAGPLQDVCKQNQNEAKKKAAAAPAPPKP